VDEEESLSPSLKVSPSPRPLDVGIDVGVFALAELIEVQVA
jgi:hypothetical protein